MISTLQDSNFLAGRRPPTPNEPKRDESRHHDTRSLLARKHKRKKKKEKTLDHQRRNGKKDDMGESPNLLKLLEEESHFEQPSGAPPSPEPKTRLKPPPWVVDWEHI